MSHQRLETAREAPPLLALSGKNRSAALKNCALQSVDERLELKTLLNSLTKAIDLRLISKGASQQPTQGTRIVDHDAPNSVVGGETSANETAKRAQQATRPIWIKPLLKLTPQRHAGAH